MKHAIWHREDPGEPYHLPIASPASTGLLSFWLVPLSTVLEFMKHWWAHWRTIQCCCTSHMYRLVMISIEKSETAKKYTGNLRQIQSETKCSPFFPTVRKNFLCQTILSQTEFCLGLNLSRTEFVLDYIPQLYFVCNLLIWLVSLRDITPVSFLNKLYVNHATVRTF